MSTINLNFGGVEPAKPFELLDDGKYVMTIEDAKIEDSKNAGKDASLKLTLRNTDTDTLVWHNLYLGEASIRFTLQFLIAVFGTKPDSLDIETQEERDEFCAGLIGMTVPTAIEKVYQTDSTGEIRRDSKGDPKWTNKVTSFELEPF